MTSPPSSLPSPVPSTSSASLPQSFSSIQPTSAIHRAPSAASGVSATSTRDVKSRGHYPNGSISQQSVHDYESGNSFDQNYDVQQTPQPSSAYNQPFLPPLTSSPPPHVPHYIPPPQHAMAPDPIHSIMMQSVGGWQNGPNGWRGTGPGQSNYGITPSYRGAMPNGPLSNLPHQLPGNPVEPFSGRSSASGMNPGLGGRPQSIPGESRERRRNRDEDGDEEVITTIFVVGFPDDMQEREFQNMFTFSPGFEAATLKFPSGSGRPREPTAALLAELSQIAANQHALGEHGDYALPPHLEEALVALSITGTASTSASTTPSAAMSMTPSAPNGPVLGGQAYPPTRRQTIGFARFKTRSEALAARDLLQGRKVDTLTGATLKAEMAKKNLHTKRTTSGEELVGLLLRSGRLASLMGVGSQSTSPPNGLVHPPQSQVIPSAPQSARDAWDAWPSQNDKDERSIQPVSYIPLATSLGTNSALNPGSVQSTTSTSPPASVTSPNTRPTDSKALLALAEEADELEGWSMSGAMGSVGINMPLEGFSHRRGQNAIGPIVTSSQTQPQPILSPHNTSRDLHAMPGYGYAQQGGLYGRETYGTSPPGGSDQLSDTGRSLGAGANPADQNPPINTLYVGNLPAISPPTHPPNFLEESLRSLFQQCLGFKRMSFRQKINGPMCFVEFEDVHCATQAIKELYGHNLGGLVKGGIRLSYSKNSLGQRGSAHPTGINTSMFGGIAHTVALAGMSSTSNGPATPHLTGSAAAYGLQLQHGQPSAGLTPTAPVAINSNGASTSLSPTAQPFTSPRSRYFGSSPNNIPPVPATATAAGSTRGDSYSFQPPHTANPTSSVMLGQSATSNGNGGNGSGSGANGQFSPMSSPIRTPASFSWKSSGGMSVGNGYGGGGYDGFVGGLGSLDGAASAWSAGANASTGSNGQGSHAYSH